MTKAFGDITDKRLIVGKGILFWLLGVLALIGNIFIDSTWHRALLAIIAIWAFCRFYYFLFYVLENYVDSSLKYSGIFALLRAILTKKA